MTVVVLHDDELNESVLQVKRLESNLKSATTMIDKLVADIDAKTHAEKILKTEYEKRIKVKDDMIRNLCRENNALQREVAELEERICILSEI